MDGMYLVVRSVADLTMERALEVARAFDAHTHLRPNRVGGDPARTKVEPSMEALVAETGLPIDWLTVRLSEREASGSEGGEVDLSTGRGAWVGSPTDEGMEFSLRGHYVEQFWSTTTMREEWAVDEVASLFEDLVVALDAAYGYVVPESRLPSGLPSLAWQAIPGVFWLNYFGPAFLNDQPALQRIAGARVLSTGGVLVKTTDQPWQRITPGIPTWQYGLRRVLGDDAFVRRDPHPTLPTIEEHLAASPGTAEMPWESWLRQRVTDQRAKGHAAARKRLAKALGSRPEPTLAPGAKEWSTSFDENDWEGFTTHLARRLRGELLTAPGKAAITVTATAPLDEEDGVLLNTDLGTIQLSWFIDDVATIDVSIFGSDEVIAVCNSWFDENHA